MRHPLLQRYKESAPILGQTALAELSADLQFVYSVSVRGEGLLGLKAEPWGKPLHRDYG